jgi:recombinational DNA repair protein (RecF pathway)
MNFRDQGVIITKNSFKEDSDVMTLFTKKHGLYSDVIKRGGKKR